MASGHDAIDESFSARNAGWTPREERTPRPTQQTSPDMECLHDVSHHVTHVGTSHATAHIRTPIHTTVYVRSGAASQTSVPSIMRMPYRASNLTLLAADHNAARRSRHAQPGWHETAASRTPLTRRPPMCHRTLSASFKARRRDWRRCHAVRCTRCNLGVKCATWQQAGERAHSRPWRPEARADLQRTFGILRATSCDSLRRACLSPAQDVHPTAS